MAMATYIMVRQLDQPAEEADHPKHREQLDTLATGLVRLLDRQRLKPHCIHHAPTGGECADAIANAIVERQIRTAETDALADADQSVSFARTFVRDGVQILVGPSKALDQIVSHGMRAGNWFSHPGSIVIMRLDQKGRVPDDGIMMIGPNELASAA